MLVKEVIGKNVYRFIDDLVRQGVGHFVVYDEKGNKIFQSPATLSVLTAAAIPGFATAARVFAKSTRCKIVYQPVKRSN